MTELDILEKLATTPSLNSKKQILKDHKNSKPLVELLDACYNYQRKFYIKKFEVKPRYSLEQEVDVHANFIGLLKKLESRTIVGNEAKKEVELFFEFCGPRQAKWYARVLRKDLKAGVSVKAAAEIAPIPIFEVQLAKDGKECKKAEEILAKGVLLSPKFDGYRCLALIAHGSVLLFSREGTVYSNFPSIEDSLIQTFPNECLVLDGEIMSDDFQSMQKSAFASKRGTTVGDVKYHVFDRIDYDEWNTKKFKQTKFERYKELVTLSVRFPSNVVLVEQKVIYTVKEATDAEAIFIDQKFEGAMTCPDIPYYLGKKSNRLMKWKTMTSEDCEIIGFYEGKDDTKHKGRLGGFVLKQEDGQTCECGSGFSDEDRDYIWNNKSEFLGRIVEAKYQEKTNHGIMRFPVFMRYRDDKAK